MGRDMKIALGGCAVVALLGVLLLGGCFALFAGSGGGTDTKSAKEEAPTVAMGETVEVGDVAWRVTEARQANQLSAQFADTIQGNFIIVNFDFTNNGSEAVTLDRESLAVVDSEGRESETEADYMLYSPKDRDIFLERVNPGVTQQGQAIFEVAPGGLWVPIAGRGRGDVHR